MFLNTCLITLKNERKAYTIKAVIFTVLAYFVPDINSFLGVDFDISFLLIVIAGSNVYNSRNLDFEIEALTFSNSKKAHFQLIISSILTELLLVLFFVLLGAVIRDPNVAPLKTIKLTFLLSIYFTFALGPILNRNLNKDIVKKKYSIFYVSKKKILLYLSLVSYIPITVLFLIYSNIESRDVKLFIFISAFVILIIHLLYVTYKNYKLHIDETDAFMREWQWKRR